MHGEGYVPLSFSSFGKKVEGVEKGTGKKPCSILVKQERDKES